MSEKIGLGVPMGFRYKSFHNCWNSVPLDVVGCVVYVNDNPERAFGGETTYPKNMHILNNEENLGVGKTKNRALKHLLDQGCDHIFLMEDDIYIKDASVFQKYIEASKATGIQHFNFSQHGIMNKTFDGQSLPNPRMIVKYGDIQVPLYPHCVGAFSYFSRKCLETVGLMDEEYYNACEHMDHTLEIIKAGMHPPFWYFADIENSWEYLGDEPWSLQQSTISSKSDHSEVMRAADQVFFKKHGHYPLQTPLTDEEGVVKSLKEIKKNYGTTAS
jgi:glycosyltransferase involved in cell wall biosynthesis